VTFDETNGSQVEQVNPNLVEEEEPPFEANKKMAIGEVRPREAQAQEQDEPLSSTRVEPPSIPLDQDQGQAHGDDHTHEQDKRFMKMVKFMSLKVKTMMVMMEMMRNQFNDNLKLLI